MVEVPPNLTKILRLYMSWGLSAGGGLLFELFLIMVPGGRE